MAAPDTHGQLRRPLGAGLIALFLAACATGPTSRSASETPPQTVAPPAPTAAPPEAEDPVAIPVKSPHTVVIEEGGEESDRKSLAEAAREEKERRSTASPPVAVVTDKNLQEHATGNLTSSSGPSTAGAAKDGEGADVAIEDRETYWRHRVRDQRRDWASTVDDILRLQQEVSELRVRFYAEDDPYVRDGRIKPQWDRALDELGDARRRAERLEEELADILEEGSRSGALPGWLREGSELEPEKRPYGEALEEAEDEAVIGEPDVIEENPR